MHSQLTLHRPCLHRDCKQNPSGQKAILERSSHTADEVDAVCGGRNWEGSKRLAEPDGWIYLLKVPSFIVHGKSPKARPKEGLSIIWTAVVDSSSGSKCPRWNYGISLHLPWTKPTLGLRFAASNDASGRCWLCRWRQLCAGADYAGACGCSALLSQQLEWWVAVAKPSVRRDGVLQAQSSIEAVAVG